MPRHRLTVAAATGTAIAIVAAVSPAVGVAAAKGCGAVSGVGNGTKVAKVTTSSGTCVAAKTAAKSFARTRIPPKGYTCKEKFTATTTANVRCTRAGRTVTFNVAWTRAMPLPPAAAPPSVNGG
ncbi:MAG: hypothetical protein QOD81_1294 [Solirubrobacteraceae bacterium]|jgi:hypothetical protein|nr:hypothetical protein [Solirubrobacteraceae bacterium]